MSRQTIPIGAPVIRKNDAGLLRARWDFAAEHAIDVGLSASGAESFLRRFQLRQDGLIFFRTAVSGSASPNVAGPELSDALEQNATAITIRVPGLDLKELFIPGPNSADGLSADPSEPYSWNSGASYTAWIMAMQAASAETQAGAKLILDDGLGGARPLALGIALALSEPIALDKARPAALSVALVLSEPVALDKARPAALGIALVLSEPVALDKARPAALSVALVLSEPVALDKARPAALGIALELAEPKSKNIIKARPAALPVALALAEPTAFERLVPVTVRAFVAPAPAPADAGVRWLRAARALSPERALVMAIEITHPDAPYPVRAVNDTRRYLIEGNEYPPVRFGARLADDTEGQPPSAEIWIDNVGHVLTQWIDVTRGGVGAQIRLLEVSVDPADPGGGEVEWEQRLEVRGVRAGRSRVTARIGVPSLRGRAAVIARHDPARSPGLF